MPDDTIVAAIVLDFRTQNAQAVDQAKGALASLNGSTKAADDAAKSLSQTFSGQQAAAAKTAADALGVYALALKEGTADTAALRDTAASAAVESGKFATALKQAAASIQQPSAPSFATQQAEASQKAKAAIESYAAASLAGSKDTAALRDEAVKATQAHVQMSQAVSKSEQEVRKLAGTSEEGAGKLAKLSNAAWAIYNPLLLIPAAIVAFAVKTSVSFDQALAHVAAFTGASTQQIEQFRTVLESMASTYGLTLNDLGQGLYTLLSASVPVKDALIALDTSAKAAAASGSQLSDVIAATTAAIKAYGLSGQQIAQFQDDMAAAVKLSSLEYADFAQNIGHVIPLAAQLNVSMKDIGTFAALVSNEGNSAAETFDLLRNLLTALAAPLNKQVTALSAMGLSVEDVNVKTQGLTTVLTRVNEALKQHIPSLAQLEANNNLSAKAAQNLAASMTNEDQVARKLFGGNMLAMRAFFAAYANGGKQWIETSEQMANTSGQVDAALAKQEQSTEFHLKQAQGAAQALAASLGETLKPQLIQGADNFTRLALAIEGAVNKLQEYYGLIEHGPKIGGLQAPGLGTAPKSVPLIGGQGPLQAAATIAAAPITVPMAALSGALNAVTDSTTKQIDAQRRLSAEYQNNQKAMSAYVSQLQHGTPYEQQVARGYNQGLMGTYTHPTLGSDPFLTHGGKNDAYQPDIGSQAKDFETAQKDASDKLTHAEEAYALAIHDGVKSTGFFSDAIASNARSSKGYADALDQAKVIAQKAVGDWAAVLQGQMVTAQKSQANALAQLTLGILSGSKNLGPLALAAANATKGSDKYTAAQQQAITMVEKLTGVHLDAAGKISTSTQKLTTALDDLTKALQDKVNQALSDVTMALLHHKGNVDALVSVGAQATAKLQNTTNKEDEARLLIARKMGDWATVIDLERTHLQKVLTDATAAYAQDRSSGAPQSVLSADKSRVDAANHALDSFNKNVTDAGAKLLTTAQRFADEQSKAQKRYEDALGAVAADFLKTGTTTRAHEAALVSSKRAVDGFTTAMDRATASALSGGALFAADQTDAQKRYDDALNTVAQDLKTSGTVTQAHWQALVKANTGLGGFSTALQQAQDRLKPPGPAADLRTDQDAAQKTYDDAVATVTRDIIAHGQATRKDLQALSDAKNGLDLFTGVAKRVAALFTTPAQRFRDQESAAQQKAANMADRLADSLMHGGSGAGIWADAAISAARVVQQYADAHAKAQAIIQAALAKTGDGFITASQRLSLLNQTIQDLIDAAVTNQTRTKPMPGAEAGASQGGTGEQSSSITKDLDAAIRDRIDLERRLNAETRKVALAEGDFSTVFSLDQQALSKSFDDLTGAFFTGTGDVAALTAAYERNKAVVDAETDSRIKAADAAGDHSQALQLITQQLQGNYNNALDGITEKLLRHQQVTQSDIDAAAGYAQSLKALTQAQWDANFAVADAAERAKLLSDRFSSIVSQASTITSAQGSVVSANLTVFNDQAAEQTRLLQSLVTEVTDQTAIISAQSGVVKAGYDGQIAAVKDQSGIEQALADIQKATTAAELAVGQQELVVARDTYQVDQEAARQNGIIARDQVRIAQVKATADRADAQAAAAVARAHLKVDQDNVTLTEDQLQLQALMLPPLEIIASAFGDVQAYQQQVVRAVTTINADQRAIWTDQQNLAVATATQQQVQGAGQLAAAQAAQQLALDQASAEASSSAGQLKIQQDTARLQSLQYQAQQQGNAIALSASSSNNALLQEQNNMFRRFFQVLASGALSGSRNYRGGGSAFLNQFTVEAHGAPSP